MELEIIVLIIIGIIFIVVSCFLVDKSSTNEKISTKDTILQGDPNISEIKQTLELTLHEVTEDTIQKTDDELSKLSNETIIAVNEFSNQVLENINKNHEEVVFLYKMLNDKEDELKNLLSAVDEKKKSMTHEIKKVSESRNNNTKIKDDFRDKIDLIHDEIYDEMHDEIHDEMYDEMHNEINNSQVHNNNNNNNSKIINLYNEGKSVVEIARILELGQGEVKLVLDLFKK